jgi:hypothetical protein
VWSCYDRVIVQGTLPVFCYAEGMTAYLGKRRIRIFDFTRFAKPLTDASKANAEEVAAASGLNIDYVRKKNFRLQFYCNGHNWLAPQLDGNQISYTLLDNAFTRIEDFAVAQQ